MKTALIGYTGFVGSNIHSQFRFTDVYNSQNIKDIQSKEYDIVVSCGVSGTKWIANANAAADLRQIKDFIHSIKNVKSKKFILISTEDVYEKPFHVDENSKIDTEHVQPYGKNRYYLEQYIHNKFPLSTIIRLPGLIGKNLKKNFIYDFLHKRKPELTNGNSVVQIYNLKNIWKDIKIAVKNDISLINFATEPIKVRDLIKEVFHEDFIYINEKKLVQYDVKTIYARYFGKNTPYLYSQEEVLADLTMFIKTKS